MSDSCATPVEQLFDKCRTIFLSLVMEKEVSSFGKKDSIANNNKQ